MAGESRSSTAVDEPGGAEPSARVVPFGVPVNASHLNWTDAGDGTMVEANLDGTGQQTIATGQSGPQVVAVGPQP